MKMPSTYVSLLLLCGLIFFFYCTHKDARYGIKPVQLRPVVKGNTPVVKKSLPADATDVYLSKNRNDGNTQEQTGAKENGFSFFKNVITHIVPALEK